MEYEFCDGLQHGGHTPRLFILKAGQIRPFTGGHIDGVVAVRKSKYVKNGKWSANTFVLELANSATPVELIAPMHNVLWPEYSRFDAYQRIHEKFPVSFEVFDAFLEKEYPEDRARMLEGESVLDNLDHAEGQSEIVEISTFQSDQKTPHSDVRVTGPNGQSWIIAHEAGKGPEVPGVFKVLGSRRSPGHRSWMTTLQIAIGPGVKAGIEQYGCDEKAVEWALGRNGNGMPPRPASES